jgi:small subunit ribosomal protein S8
MSMTDPISDMLTRIRNAGKAKFNSVDIPGSNLKVELARVLKEQGYIKNYKYTKNNNQGVLRVFLKYDEKQNFIIYGLKRVSKPSRRVYVRNKDIKPVLNGYGIAVMSTSQGIMTDKEAIKKNVGGEILCNIW